MDDQIPSFKGTTHDSELAEVYAELYRQQEAANKRLQVLQQAQKAIDSATDLEEVLVQILTEGLRTVNTERGSLMLIEGGDLITKAQFGPEISDPGHMKVTFKVGEGIAGIVADTGEAVLCPDVFKDDRFKPPLDRRQIRFRSLLTVPNWVPGVVMERTVARQS